MKNKILIIDIETTNFLSKGGCIVEVGIVSLDLSDGKVELLFDSLLREDSLSSKHRRFPFGWIFENSSLTVDEVRNAPSADGVLADVQKIINKFSNGCTAFNNKFDFDFLESRGIVFPKKLSCPMLLSTPICKIPHKNGKKGNKWPSVEEAWKFFFPESEYVEKHRGGDDAKHEAKIVYELYNRGVFKLE